MERSSDKQGGDVQPEPWIIMVFSSFIQKQYYGVISEALTISFDSWAFLNFNGYNINNPLQVMKEKQEWPLSS